MAQLNINEIAAIDRLANILGPLVTNSIIDSFAEQLRLRSTLAGTNKQDKITSLLTFLMSDKRTRSQAETLVNSLTMAAHSRAMAKKVEMTEDQVDAIVAEMRCLRLSAADLAKKSWRAGLKKTPAPSKATVPTPPSSPAHSAAPRPTVHEKALEHVRHLLDPATNPQVRGRQLELVVFGLLRDENLMPDHRIVIPGEEMDLSFVLDGHHYLVECKWEAAPVGLAPVEHFSTKVRRKAEGTFGVMLSMSGYVENINETASRGERLNCVGLNHQHLMAVLEGRTTWTETVRRARRAASSKSVFAAPQ